jgi:GT2 family glycosyltransferase
MASIAAAIPTFARDQVLIDTIKHVMRQRPRPKEILILDQSPNCHAASAQSALAAWHKQGMIRWLHLPRPSIPAAMNKALLETIADLVLFLDDDVVLESGLIGSHRAAHNRTSAAIIAGRVIQPWQEGVTFPEHEGFHFAARDPRWTDRFMGGNFSVRREVALRLGGFDENFVHVAYNFEVEFAHRLLSSGYKIYFEPEACLHHLKAPGGGTRFFSEHLETFKPSHSVGAYYCLMRTKTGWNRIGDIYRRLFGAVLTRHHLQRPWWIPGTLLAEITGFVWALALVFRGPRYLGANGEAGS